MAVSLIELSVLYVWIPLRGDCLIGYNQDDIFIGYPFFYNEIYIYIYVYTFLFHLPLSIFDFFCWHFLPERLSLSSCATCLFEIGLWCCSWDVIVLLPFPSLHANIWWCWCLDMMVFPWTSCLSPNSYLLKSVLLFQGSHSLWKYMYSPWLWFSRTFERTWTLKRSFKVIEF